MKKILPRGFTLIELLIVVAIIAVLSTIGLITYGNFLKKSRDTKRQSDLKFIQSALEEYHSDQFYYPVTVTPGSPLQAGTKIYMTKVPSDPNYSYVPSPAGCTTTNCTGYCLFAKMEGPAPVSDPGCTSTDTSIFGVTRP